LGDVYIRETVSVVVTHGYSHAVAATGHAGFLRNIGESSVAIVSVKRIAERPRGSIKIATSAVDEVDIHPPVVVIIEKSAARAAALREIFHGRLPGNMDPVDAADFRGHFLKEILLSGSGEQWPGGGSRSPQTAGSPCKIPQETAPGSACSSLGTLRHEQSVSVKVPISA
jgi:hypothetical protein